MNLRRYQAHQKTGLNWLPELPAHWQLRPLKHLCAVLPSNVDKKTHDGERPVFLCNYTDVYHNDQIVAGMSLMQATASDDQIEKFTLRAGDTIITKDSETADDIAVSAHVPRDLPGVVCGYHLAVLRPRPATHGLFVKWLFDSTYVKSSVAVRANGLTRVGLAREDLESIQLPFPPLKEQKLIAEFLHTQNEMVDALVEDQRHLIELLEEKRQAFIVHAVTRGLCPETATKASGVDWLGDVPAHWASCRNKVVFREVDERNSEDSGELMTVSHLTGVTPRAEKDVNMFLAETLEGYKTCRRGDLVINTMWAWMGALGCSPCDGVVSPSYNVYRPRQEQLVSADYYDYLCRIPAHRVAMKAQSTGVWESRLRLYPKAFLDMRVALPPFDEQIAIAAWIREHTSKWELLIRTAQHAIDILEERRLALITAAVTGQVDVRHLEQEVPA